MSRVVIKYGGSSLATIQCIKNVAISISTMVTQYDEIVVVVSAMGKSTDALIHESLAFAPNARELDRIMATGEMKSSALLAMALCDIGLRAVSFNAYDTGLVTNEHFGRAFISSTACHKILSHLSLKEICVVAGFQGVSLTGELTTLGRGGSDTTAVALASVLDCPCHIYTDVSGVYTVSPKDYPTARKLSTIDIDHMTELASNGANILQTRSVELASKYGVPLYVGLSTEEQLQGTCVTHSCVDEYFESMRVVGIASQDDVSLVTVSTSSIDIRLPAHLLSILGEVLLPIHCFAKHICLSTSTISFVIPCNKVQDVVSLIDRSSHTVIVEVDDDIAVICLVGSGMSTHADTILRAVTSLESHNIPCKYISSTAKSITIIVSSGRKTEAITVLAEQFEL